MNVAGFLIWSNEHMAWWKPNRLGYSPILQEAGSYTEDEADDICADNFRGTGKKIAAEVKVLDPRLATYESADKPSAHQALYEALSALLPYLPDENDLLTYASINGGQASKYHCAAVKARKVLADTQKL